MPKPVKRSECADVQRPCKWRGCRYHMRTNQDPTMSKLVPRSSPSCSLDVAEEGANTLEEVGVLLGVTRERARQIERVALLKLRKRGTYSKDAQIFDFVNNDAASANAIKERAELVVQLARVPSPDTSLGKSKIRRLKMEIHDIDALLERWGR